MGNKLETILIEHLIAICPDSRLVVSCFEDGKPTACTDSALSFRSVGGLSVLSKLLRTLVNFP
jgi:hypothetical protein